MKLYEDVAHKAKVSVKNLKKFLVDNKTKFVKG